MFLCIWDAHIDASDAATQAADDADNAEVERMLHAAQQDALHEEDYDPFADIDDDELDPCSGPVAASSATAAFSGL